MAEFTVPPGIGKKGPGSIIADGPFVVEHGSSERFVAVWLEVFDEDLYGIWDGSRTFELDSSYKVTQTDSELSFISRQYLSSFTLRELTSDDLSWITDTDETDLEKAREDLYELLTAS